jgi:phosphoribosylformylglycinamidine cyclo-ligase
MSKLSYKNAGVDIDAANDTKKAIGPALETTNKRVLNKIGAFATLFDGKFPGYTHPILVFKTEEPGTKQKLALQHDSVESICHDLVNHLVNDAIVMGAKPLSVQDCIVCGKMEKSVIVRMVQALSEACKNNECVLTGGETSEQPGVVEAGTYIMSASIVGVVEKSKIIDGSKIKAGDVVLALASSGVHTNGMSLVRKVIEVAPEISKEIVDDKPFIQAILTPHRAYYRALKGLFGNSGLTGLAHITGGGIKENLNRILPANLDAVVDLSTVRILPIFRTLKKVGNLDDNDMLRTFNMGVGIAAVVRKEYASKAALHLRKQGIDTYPIGVIQKGSKDVTFVSELQWS